MPSKKHKIQTLLDDEMYYKFKELCEIEDRSESKLAGRIIIEHIKNYEKQKGAINVGDISQNGDNNSISIG